MNNVSPAIIVDALAFYDAPSDIEGSPYWVDLWASVNGYRIGLQIKPQTYKAASVAVYSGKAMSSQKKGHKLFKEKYGGKVFIASPNKGKFDQKTKDEILEEINKLNNLPAGDYPVLP